MSKKNSFPICVFISGTGSNLASVVRHQKIYNVALVVSNNKNAKGLDIAHQNQIPVFIIDWDEKDHLMLDLQREIKKHDCQLIVLAGFMKILPQAFISVFEHQIINIHPSLLPKYPGLNTHQRVLDNKDKIHGATVHFVNDKLDAGTIISQTVMDVEHGSNKESLAKQLLFREHSLLPYTIDMFAQKFFHWQDDQLYFKNKIFNKPIQINE